MFWETEGNHVDLLFIQSRIHVIKPALFCSRETTFLFPKMTIDMTIFLLRK